MFSIQYLRQFRILGFAIFDFAITFLAAYLLAPLLTKLFRKIRIAVPKRNWLYLALPVAILTHYIFGVMTPMTSQFLDLQGHYFLKLLILILIVLGLKDIRIIKSSKR